MGNEIECCRRPQGLGKKDLKTYKGPQKNKVSSFKTPTFDAINDYEKRRAKKKGFDQSSNGVTGHSSSYLDSIYENKNNYPSSNQFHDFSKFNIEPVSEPTYTPQANVPEVQTQQNISEQYKNGNQYVKSYTLPPQNQAISTQQYMDTFQNNQYTQSTQPQPQLQQTSSNYTSQEQNNYVKNTPTNYVSSQTEQYISSQPIQYSNPQNGESSQPFQYSNSQNVQTSSPIQYVNAQKFETTQPFQYFNAQNSESSQPIQYIAKEPANYVKNAHIQNQYIEKPQAQTQYIESSSTQYTNSNPIQYIKDQHETYTNYEPQIEYSKPETQAFSQYLEPQTKTQYIEAQPEIQQTKYIQMDGLQDENQYVKPKSQIRQYIEVNGPQDEIQYIKPKSQKRQYIEVEGPQDEIHYVRQKSQKRQYIEVEGPEDEIQYVKPKTQKRQYIEVEEPEDEIQYMKPKSKKRKYIEVEEPQDEAQYVQRKPRIRKYIEVEEPSDEIEYVERQPRTKQYIETKSIYKEPQNAQYLSKPKRVKYIKKNKKYIEREQYIPDYQPPDDQFSPAGNNFPKFQQEPQQYDLSGEQQEEDEQYMEDTEEGPEDNKRPIKILPPKYLKVKTRPVQYIDSDEQSNQNYYYEEEREEKFPKYSKKVNQEFSPDGYKRFYPSDDPFFKRPKGKKSYKVYNEEDEDKREIYEGEMMDGKKHGFGKLTTKDYIREGTWKEDKFTGWGRESRSNGEILEGRFVDGKVEGKGILRDSKGSSYIGDFVDSKRQGFGELDTKKANYKGEFKDNKFNGHGKVKIKEDGSEIEAEFRNGDIEKERNDILNGGKVIKSANIEKKEESHACQVPGFISSFFSKIFD